MKKVKLYFDGVETDPTPPVCLGGMSLDGYHRDEKGFYGDYVANAIFNAPDGMNPDELIGKTSREIKAMDGMTYLY
jgi:hypothetical protein